MSEEIGKNETSPGGKGEILDPSEQKDRRLISRALRKRWPISDEIKALLVKRAAQTLLETDDPRAIAGVGRIITQMEAQNQADEHLDDKNRRMDDGKPTETVKSVYTVEFDS